MRRLSWTSVTVLGGSALLALGADPLATPADAPNGKDYSNAPIVVRMLAFSKRKDGQVSRDEVTDPRLLRLFDEADANRDGVVTKDELTALAARLDSEAAPGDRNGPPRGYRDNPPPPRGERDGPPSFAPPRPGMILPPLVVDALRLTDEQKKQLDDLQKEVDAKLGKILTADQKQQLKDMSTLRGRGRDGPGRDGPGRDGPPPPRGDRDNPPQPPARDRENPPPAPERPGPDRDR
jgi:hypothetical protein